MKAAAQPLIELFASTNQLVMWDQYTITLADGSQLRYVSGDEGVPPCFVENFAQGLTPYSNITGNAALFTIVSTPYGNGINCAVQTSGTQARIRRAMPSRVARSFSAKFKITAFNNDDAAVITMVQTATMRFEFNPRVELATDVTRRAQLAFSGAGVLLGASALALATWYQVDALIAPGSNQTVCTVKRLSDSVVMSTTLFTETPPTVDGLEFHLDSSVTNSSVQYADIHAC